MLVRRFPPGWLCTVTVKRDKLDARGDYHTGDEHEIPYCLVGWQDTETSQRYSDVTSDRVVLLIDDPDADIETADRVVVPEGGRPDGEFQVFGRPKRWPLGVQVTLVRGDDVG